MHLWNPFLITSRCNSRSFMAWRSHGKCNKSLIEQLIQNKVLTNERVARVMSQVDRGHYSPHDPYKDSPMGIGYGATISAPHMHVRALEDLEGHLRPGAKVMDVGSGSGYLTSCMALLVDDGSHDSKVIGIDHIPELVALSKKNILKDSQSASLLERGVIKLVVGDGRKGYPQEGPYNAIHVGAAAPHIPQELIDQLAPGGRMIIPVGPEGDTQEFQMVDKGHMDGEVKVKTLLRVNYVPLTDEQYQRRRGGQC